MYGKLSNGFKDSIKHGLSKKAEEQKLTTYNLIMHLYLILQHPFFMLVLLPVTFPIVFLIKFAVKLMGIK